MHQLHYIELAITEKAQIIRTPLVLIKVKRSRALFAFRWSSRLKLNQHKINFFCSKSHVRLNFICYSGPTSNQKTDNKENKITVFVYNLIMKCLLLEIFADNSR